MSPFAKLFDTKVGQVLCVLNLSGDEEGPEITFTCKPEELGLCSTKITFKDTDTGASSAQRKFDKLTAETAFLAVLPIYELTGHPL